MARPRDPLPRLNLNGPMNLHQQGPMPFSPALPTAIQQGFPPSFPMNNPLQTPMQPFFTQPPIPHHGRPGHLPGQHSIAGIPGAGMRPPNGFPPMTPVGGHGHFSRPSLMGIPGAPGMPGHPFPNRNRRQPSIGGPPKAVLGGPTRKVTPLPPVLNPPPPPAPKTKKVNINLPKETIPGEEGEEPRREPWARNILDGFEFKDQDIPPVNLSTAEPYPSDQERYHLPTLVDVFLPGKQAWQELKQQAIEEKLEKLGVEKGSGSNMPHIHAPHARAASISSPADPQILLYKLNKLHASQENSPVTSLAGSPNLAMGAPVPRFLQNRHGHAMSLALPMLNPSAPAFDPFGQHQQEVVLSPGAGLQDSIHASGIRSGGLSPGLVAPLHSSRPTSRPDFTRGFGLDIPDEAEEEELEAEETEEKEEQIIHAPVSEPAEDAERHDTFSPRFHERKTSQESRAVDDIGVDYDRTHSERDRMSISQSRVHSRHVSRLSAALSTRSAGALDDEEFIGEEDVLDSVNYNNPVEADEEEEVAVEERESDPVAEWTGTEDVYESSDDDESIGEWSNPSDEERARQHRIERRARRRASQQIDLPRRLPLFPRPPDIIGLSSYQEDDIISNPSDEEREVPARPFTFGQQHAHLIRPASSHDDGLGDSLSPVQHNRGPSDQHSLYDPAHAHSRESSQFVYPTNNDMSHQPQSSISSSTRRDPALNPFAKPFVFGASRPSWAPPETPQADTPTPPQSAGHVRAPSTGKSLNAAAPEFKPGGFSFNFKPPPGVPSMPQIPLELRAPSPEVEHSSPLRVQGREKRQKLGSDDFTEEGDSMASFRFPPAPAYTQKDESAPEIVRRSHAPADSIKGHRLNPSAEPFKFPGFAAAVKAAPAKDTDSDMVDDLVQSPAGSEPMELDEDEDADKENRVIASPEGVEQALHDESTLKGSSNVDDDPFAMPLVRPKRAPIPLDFKHPVSTNTVPAGLFKALVNNGDGPARRSTIHSRMTSREIFEHNREPSMDDANVPSISNVTSRSRSRLVTDPGNRRASPHDDVFGGNTGHARRRSSFTDAIRPIRPLSRSDAQTNSASSAASLTGRFELQLTEKRIETLFEDRFSALSKSLYQDASERHAITQSVLAEIQSMFRSQLRDSVARSLEDSQLDARADLDIQLFKDIVENANQELIKYFGEEVQALQQQVWESRTNADHSMDASSALEEMANRTISAIVEAVSELSARQEAINHNVPAREHDALVDKLMTVLTPVLASIRTEPVDYEFLTSQLTQAVKPHISQLIDLASDKRETAGLIVERILPLLPSTNFDIDAVTRQLTAEVRRAIAPIDAFEIKEQVADLVVERLDSRLSVRDKAFNVDTIVTKMSENMSQALATLNALPSNLEAVSSKLESASEHQAKAAESQEQTLQLLDSLPAKLTVELASLKDIQSTQADILAELHRQATTDVKAEVPDLVTPALESLTAAQKDLTSQASSIKIQNDTVLEQLSTLPASFETAIGALQTSQAELFATLTTSQGEMDELKKSNSDLQIQLNKARGAHGQIRVEKDTLQNKLASVEGERERLKIQLEGARASGNERVAQVSSLEAKNKELEAALAQALEKLQVSDVAAQASQQRISELESANLQLNSENQGLKSKVEAVQLEVSFINKAKESVAERLAAQQEQYAQLQLQQSQWDELRRTSEKLDLLSTMVSQLDNEELQELRRYRDRTKTLEGEHSALQRRFKDQEAKLSNNERAAFTARQSLSQAQSRASEWEKRTKEYEGKVELLQTKLEHAEQTHAQLEADHSLVKLQLEEREANDRLVVDQQTKMQNTIAGLEAKISYLQSELETARSIKVAPTTNGHAPPRPDSRASTIFDRSSTPVGRTNTPPQPQASVWDSMHAPSPLSNGTKPVKAAQPKIQAPRSKYPYPSNLTQAAMKQHHSFHQPPQHLRRSTASPAPSAISAAPTQGDDGWWE